MKYLIVVKTEIDYYPFTDNNGWALYFPDEISAKRYVDKFEKLHVYDADKDNYDITIEEVNKPYTQDNALILVNMLLDLIEN